MAIIILSKGGNNMMRTCKENNCAGFGAFDARYDQGDVQGGMRKRYRDSFREELLLLIVKSFC